MSLPTFVTGWLLVGVVIAVLLLRQGHATELVLMAVIAWPLTAPLLSASNAAGPNAARIDRAVRALREVVPGDLDGLRAGLHRVDARLARIDQLLADTADLPADEVERLRTARQRTEAGLSSVLADLARVRVRAGLAGDAAPLVDVGARVRALEEVAGLLGDTGSV